MTVLKLQAIQTALIGNWNSAILLNQELLRQDPTNIDTLNRLAFAYSITGRIQEAKETYQKVLLIDSLNSIAQRGLKRLAETNDLSQDTIPSDNSPFSTSPMQFTNIFLEETGKTKVIELINVTNPKTVSHLRTGEFVSLCIKRLKIFVLNAQKQYIGMLPDNIGKRLIKLLKGGNCYEAYIKCLENNHLTIFIREIKRATRFKNQPSFLSLETSLFVVAKKQSDSLKKRFVQKEPDDDQRDYSSTDDSF